MKYSIICNILSNDQILNFGIAPPGIVDTANIAIIYSINPIRNTFLLISHNSPW